MTASRRRWLLLLMAMFLLMPAFAFGFKVALFAIPVISVFAVAAYYSNKRKAVDLAAGLCMDEQGLTLGSGAGQKSLFYEEIQTVAVQCAPDKSLIRITLSGPNGGFIVEGLADMEGFRSALAEARPAATWNVTMPWLDTRALFFVTGILFVSAVPINIFFLSLLRIGWGNYIWLLCLPTFFISSMRKDRKEGIFRGQ